MKIPYDVLFGDDEGTRVRQAFVKRHAAGTHLLECACGSGDLLALLYQDYEVMGIDLDPEMIETALKKYPFLENHIQIGDFTDFHHDPFDTLVCLGDSLNYLLDRAALRQFVSHSLHLADTLILDCHHPYRLQEFADGYDEEGVAEGYEYAYQIQCEGETLIHVINYLDGTFDIIEQWVFDPRILIDLYEQQGCHVDVYTDFDTAGLAPIGEKAMLVIRKDGKQ